MDYLVARTVVGSRAVIWEIRGVETIKIVHRTKGHRSGVRKVAKARNYRPSLSLPHKALRLWTVRALLCAGCSEFLGSATGNRTRV